MLYNLKKISGILNAEFYGNHMAVVRYVLFDSRMIIPSLESIFFAITTQHDDGHNYINDLYIKGLRNFVVNSFFKNINKFPDANFIIVQNTVDALRKLSEYHRQQFDTEVVAVTGSNGKTIVKEWLSVLMSDYKNTLQSPNSYNSQIGVSLSVLELKKEHEIAVFEAGISKPGEMQNLRKIIRPDIGIFTGIGDAHQENFSDIKSKLLEKLQLFENCNTIIYNSDSKLINDTILKNYDVLNKFTFGYSASAKLRILNKKAENNTTKIELLYANKSYFLSLNFIDNASIENIFLVLSTLLAVLPDKTPNDFNFSKLQSLEMRLQQLEGKNNCTIINDSYNCDMTSLRIALDVLHAQNQHNSKTIILSDIFQVGSDKKLVYTQAANLLNSSKINQFIGIGNEISKYAELFHLKKSFFASTTEFLSATQRFDFSDQAILLKGARKYEFEKISNLLQLKNHRTVLEINLRNFEHNLQYFRSLLLPETKLMIMVKAFSYGSGSYEIANFLQLRNVDYLAVAIADEGIELRKYGITIPIVVLNPDIQKLDILVQYALEPEIYNFKILNAFYNAVKYKVNNCYPVHIKLNTGMNRLGFSKKELPKLIDFLLVSDKIFVKSVFSHLVGSDSSTFDAFTRTQIIDFKQNVAFIENKLNYKFLKHILNSAGIQRFNDAQFDMVRLGIGLYGIGVEKNNFLKNISRLKTRIVQIIKVKKGQTVGYNRVGKVLKNSVIATLPIGYADGLNRKLGNRVGRVRINDKYAEIIGNICMDLTMIDITNIDASEGDEVIVFDDEYTVSDIANCLDTIPYEILTSISQRIKRIYVWD